MRTDPFSDTLMWLTDFRWEVAIFWLLRDLVRGVFEPMLPIVGTLIYFAELFFAVTLMLGVLTRLGALLALGQATFLWIGLYQAPNEWPWNYVFLMIVHGFFINPGRQSAAIPMRRRSQTPPSTYPTGLLWIAPNQSWWRWREITG